jgi:hypothetical protein
MKHLRFDCYSSTGHPQEVMKELEITYQIAVPQSIADQWWFWNCENIPDPLPEYLSELDLDPMDCIGYGLSAEEAIMIRDNTRIVSKELKLSRKEGLAILVKRLKENGIWDLMESITIEGEKIK